MDPVTIHTGQCAVLRRSDVDTDQIIPADFCRLPGRSGFAKGLFARWRNDPTFMLNDPAAVSRSVLLAGPRFGTGSSREHAVWALREWGFAVIVAPSFGDIFARNALRNGLLVVRLPGEVVESLMSSAETSADGLPLTVDLVRREVRAGDGTWGFVIDERARWLLLNGYDDIEVTMRHDQEIADYERHRASWLPALQPTGRARTVIAGHASP